MKPQEPSDVKFNYLSAMNDRKVQRMDLTIAGNESTSPAILDTSYLRSLSHPSFDACLSHAGLNVEMLLNEQRRAGKRVAGLFEQAAEKVASKKERKEEAELRTILSKDQIDNAVLNDQSMMESAKLSSTHLGGEHPIQAKDGEMFKKPITLPNLIGKLNFTDNEFSHLADSPDRTACKLDGHFTDSLAAAQLPHYSNLPFYLSSFSPFLYLPTAASSLSIDQSSLAESFSSKTFSSTQSYIQSSSKVQPFNQSTNSSLFGDHPHMRHPGTKNPNEETDHQSDHGNLDKQSSRADPNTSEYNTPGAHQLISAQPNAASSIASINPISGSLQYAQLVNYFQLLLEGVHQSNDRNNP